MENRLNTDKIRRISSEIKESLSLLRELKKLDQAAFSSDKHRISSAKYNLIVAIEGAIDLCNHLIAAKGWKTPDDYAETFRICAAHGVIDETFLETLIKMAKFRNRLVHIYWNIDTDEIHRILQENLDDVEVFLEKFMDYIT